MVVGFGTVSWPVWLTLDTVERGVGAALEDVASLLPGRWRDKLGSRRKVVVIDAPRDEQAIDVTLPDGRRARLETSGDAAKLQKAARAHSVALRVPDAEILSTVLRLPRRTLSRLDDVVTTNVPVWTPFAADELYLRARVAGERSTTVDDGRHPTREVELRCVPKATLARRLSVLAGRSLEVDEVWLGSDGSFSCDLGSKKTKTARRERRFVSALVGLAIIQVFALSVVYRLRQDEQIETLERNIDRIRQVVHAQAARVQRDRDTTRMLATIEARATGPESMTFALKRLAAVLPAGARYKEANVSSAGGGALTLISGDRIDPVSLVAATGLLTVTEVNELNGAQEGEHTYAVAFKTIRPKSDPD